MNKESLMNRFLVDNPNLQKDQSTILAMVKTIIDCYKSGGKLLICGNGGSSADSDHIVGELMKGFDLRRPLSDTMKSALEKEYGDKVVANQLQWGLPAISLTQHAALIFATSNDIDPDLVFAQQVAGYGRENDVLLGISTSGHATNVNHAVRVGKALGLRTLALTGKTGGELAQYAELSLVAPAMETYRIQEYHLAVYHVICLLVEEELFGENGWLYEPRH